MFMNFAKTIPKKYNKQFGFTFSFNNDMTAKIKSAIYIMEMKITILILKPYNK